MPYLTANSVPGDTICRVLFIPNDREFIGNVTGALQLLTFPNSFVSEGGISPDDMAEAYKPMFDAFCFNEGVCRVIGEVIAFAGTTSPDARWLLCDGASLLRTDYPDLFTVIGTTYGAADGTHFNVPDLRGRSISGVGTGTGLSPVSAGDVYGEQDHTLIVAEIPSHTHTDTGHIHGESAAAPTAITIGAGVPAPSAVPAASVTGSASASLTNTGGDGAHNNVGPRLGINYLIVAL